VFGISGLELVILAVLALLVFGPDRLPGVAKEAGQMIRQLRRMAQEAREEVSGVFPEFDDLDVRDLDPRHFVRRQLLEEKDDLDAAIDDRPATGRRSSSASRAAAGEVPAVDPPADSVVAESPPSGPTPWDAEAT
jgi:sec-independent protein translocase protein TatB